MRRSIKFGRSRPVDRRHCCARIDEAEAASTQPPAFLFRRSRCGPCVAPLYCLARLGLQVRWTGRVRADGILTLYTQGPVLNMPWVQTTTASTPLRWWGLSGRRVRLVCVSCRAAPVSPKHGWLVGLGPSGRGSPLPRRACPQPLPRRACPQRAARLAPAPTSAWPPESPGRCCGGGGAAAGA